MVLEALSTFLENAKESASTHYNKYRWRHALFKYPESLPSSRPRALTLPLPPPVPSKRKPTRFNQQTASQHQSDLVSKLPKEIRLMIWELALGGNVLHIVNLENRLGHIICRDPDRSRYFLHRCWKPVPSVKNGMMPAECGYPPKERGLLSLLKTCRRIYSEAIGILYTHNTFDFSRAHLWHTCRAALVVLPSLPRTLLPYRFNAIRSIQVIWEFTQPLYLGDPPYAYGRKKGMPWDEDTWERFWDVVAGMAGLRELRVLLGGGGAPGLSDCEVSLLEPLRAVRGLNVFEVRVEWERCAFRSTGVGFRPGEFEEWLAGCPFRLVRVPVEETVMFYLMNGKRGNYGGRGAGGND